MSICPVVLSCARFIHINYKKKDELAKENIIFEESVKETNKVEHHKIKQNRHSKLREDC